MHFSKPVTKNVWKKTPSPVSSKDLSFLAGLPFLTLLAWLTNESTWHKIADKAAHHSSGILSRDAESILARVLEVAGDRTLAIPPTQISHDLTACEIETTFQIMADHFPKGWHPAIEIEGEEHLKSALSLGRGAILWDSHFYFAGLITKIGLYSIGYRLHHLSRREHGFSSTPFGMNYLNPIRTFVERRYLGDRVVMPANNPGSVLVDLAERLKQNAVVSITVRGRANRPVRAPFLNSFLDVAPGAPYLAWTAESKLIPVFTVREEVGRYRIVLGSPISLPRYCSREESIKSAAIEYAKRLEQYVLDYPGQWIDWINI